MIETLVIIKGKDGYGKEKMVSLTVLHDSDVDPIEVVKQEFEIPLTEKQYEKNQSKDPVKYVLQYSPNSLYLIRK